MTDQRLLEKARFIAGVLSRIDRNTDVTIHDVIEKATPAEIEFYYKRLGGA